MDVIGVNAQPICEVCHVPIHPTYFFCPNCGKKLKEPPPATTIEKQISVYLISIFMPPFGLFWAFKYLRQPDAKSRTIGWISVFLTVVAFIATLYTTKIAMDRFNKLLNEQMMLIQGF